MVWGGHHKGKVEGLFELNPLAVKGVKNGVTSFELGPKVSLYAEPKKSLKPVHQIHILSSLDIISLVAQGPCAGKDCELNRRRIPFVEQRPGWIKIGMEKYSPYLGSFMWMEASSELGKIILELDKEDEEKALIRLFSEDGLFYLLDTGAILLETKSFKESHWLKVQIPIGPCWKEKRPILIQGWIPWKSSEGRETFSYRPQCGTD